jgi:heme-degrading monooxygenase HmoA
MTVVRIAVYPVDVGQLDALKQSVDADLVPLYHQQPGFESLSIVTCGDDVVSVSRWDSHDHAEAGSKAAIVWAAHAPGSTGPPSAVYIGAEMNSA